MIPRKKRRRYRESAIRIASKHGIELNPDDWSAIWALLDSNDENAPDYLYAVSDLRNRLIKFGHSRHPGARFKSLRTGNGSLLSMWGYCEQKSPLTEREVHARLAAHRERGEWFRLTPDVQEVVDEIRAAYKRSQRTWAKS